LFCHIELEVNDLLLSSEVRDEGAKLRQLGISVFRGLSFGGR
jgi:hypothetical protein